MAPLIYGKQSDAMPLLLDTDTSIAAILKIESKHAFMAN